MIDMNEGESQARWVSYKPQKDEWVYNDGEVEETNPSFIFDYVNIKAGWGKIQAGSPPEYHWWANTNIKEPQPSEEFKKALSVDLYFNSEHMKGVYSWTTNANGPVTGILEIYSKIFAEKEGRGEKLPVLKYVGSEEKKFSVGSTKIPQFEIAKWVDRPGDWDVEPEPAQESMPGVEKVEEADENIPF
jgi:hypothetical protein